MFCTNCGAKIEDTCKFCTRCGARVEAEEVTANVQQAEPIIPVVEEAQGIPAMPYETAAGTDGQSVDHSGPVAAEGTADYSEPQQKTGKTGLKKLWDKVVDFVRKHKLPSIIAAAALVLVVVLIIVLANVLGGSKGTSAGCNYNSLCGIYNYSSDEDETVFFYNGKQIDRVSDSLTLVATAGKEYDVQLYVNVNDYDEYYCVTRNGADRLDEDVSSYQICLDGSAIYYRSGDDLYRYTVSNGNEDKIAEDVSSYTASPDGNTVVYRNYDGDLCLNNDKNVISDENYEPLAVSNGASRLYVTDQDSIYSMTTKGVAEEIDDYGSYNSYMLWNEDLTQALYYINGHTYLYTAGSKKTEKICSDTIYPVEARDTAGIVTTTQQVILQLRDFRSQIYYGDGELIYVDDKLEDTELESYDQVIGMVDQVIYYIRDNRLYRIQSKADAEGEKLARDVSYSGLILTDDGKIYYLSTENELYVYAKGESTLIEEDVSSVTGSANNTVFVVYDGYKLGYVNGTEIEDIEKDVTSYTLNGEGVLYWTDGELNYSTGKTTTENILDK